MDLSEYHQVHQLEKAARAGCLWGDGGDQGGGGRSGGSSPPAALVVGALDGDELPRLHYPTSAETADVPCKLSVKETLRRAAVAALADAPLSNTGHKFTVHWADMTIFAPIGVVADLVAAAFFDDYVGVFEDGGALERFEDCGPVRMYGQLLRGPAGICIKADNTVGNREHCCVTVPGSAFELFGMACFQRLLAAAEDRCIEWHLTRLDNAFDEVDFTPQDVYDAIYREDVRSLAERKTLRMHLTPFGDQAGSTCDFGKRGSADFLRVYDMRGFTRVEHECRRNRAKFLGYLLVNAPIERWASLALASLRDFFDLVERAGVRNVKRCPLLPFWKKFVGEVARCEVKISAGLSGLKAQAAATVERVSHEVKRVRRGVQKLLHLFGEESFLRLMKCPVEFMRPVDRIQLENWRAVVQNVGDVMDVSLTELVRAAVDEVCTPVAVGVT